MTEETNDNAERYCPICETWMEEEICPTDQVPTIRREILEEQSSFIPEGTILGGRYEIKKLIGLGGMGAVYLGNQTNMHRRVAIKTLKKELMSNERLLKRFYREARAAAALDHPNIVKVYDFGLDSDQGCPYIAMEYLEGQSLDALIEAEERVNEARACVIVGDVARALTDAHSKGVVHRDLKPDNVHVQSLSDGSEHIKVLDFGIAKIRRPDGTPTEKLTGTGMALGTPYYMSPEQAMGKPADFRSDLYALGCILYQLLSGQLPFDAEQPMAVLLKQLREPAPPLPELLCDGEAPSDSLRHLYMSLMAKKPEDRPDSTLSVADRLAECVKRARGQVVGGSDFSFGHKTLGPNKKAQQSSVEPGLETLVRSSMGEKETLAFGAVAGDEVAEEAEGITDSEFALSAANQKRLTPMIVAAVVLLVLGTVAWFFSGSNPKSEQETLITKQSDTAPTKKKSEVKKVVPPAPKPAPKSMDVVSVALKSTPSGAAVFDGSRKLGVTPLKQRFETKKLPVKLRFVRTGFDDSERTVTQTTRTLAVTLKPTADLKTKVKPSPKTITRKSNKLGNERSLGKKEKATPRPKVRPKVKRRKPKPTLKRAAPQPSKSVRSKKKTTTKSKETEIW